MAYAVGLALSLIVMWFARATGLDRDRAFYPILVIAIASYYVLFAIMAGSTRALIAESIVMVPFLLVAVIGFKANLWLVVVGLAAHGIFDAFHGRFAANPGVPEWWPAFCSAFDIGAAGFLAWLLMGAKVLAR
ncbi:MAG TPA: hypothetical protein VF175_17475 [Lacipirellula sp.]